VISDEYCVVSESLDAVIAPEKSRFTDEIKERYGKIGYRGWKSFTTTACFRR